MKVVQMVTRMNLGGPAREVVQLTEGLRAKGHKTVLVAGVCEERAGDIPASVPPGLEVQTLSGLSRSISPIRDLLAIWRAYRIIKRERPDVVHTHTAKAGLVGRVAAWLAGVPVIVHTFHGNSLSGYFSPVAAAVFRSIEQVLARITDRICVLSEQQFEEISGRFRIGIPEQYVIVPVGIDMSTELSLGPPAYGDVLNVGWLGRLVDIKNVKLLSEVIDEAFRRGLRVRFLVGGDGPDRPLIESAIARHGRDRVEWTGWQRDVRGFLAKCHVLIQTSKNEGTPIALIQGMAAARPFISTPAGGVVDLVRGPALFTVDGCAWYANGVLANPGSAAFADALARLRSTPSLLAGMGCEARAFAAARFQAERLIDDIERLYRDLMRSSAAEPSYTGESQCTF